MSNQVTTRRNTYGSTTNSPVGYHNLGQSYPRSKNREVYPSTNRTSFVFLILDALPPRKISFDRPISINSEVVFDFDILSESVIDIAIEANPVFSLNIDTEDSRIQRLV